MWPILKWVYSIWTLNHKSVIDVFALKGSVATVLKDFYWLMLLNMSHDMTKPTKWVCAQRRLRSAVHMKKAWVLSYPLSAQRRFWSDWADAQADLSLRWAHTHFVGFVVSQLICHMVLSKPEVCNVNGLHHYDNKTLAQNNCCTV